MSVASQFPPLPLHPPHSPPARLMSPVVKPLPVSPEASARRHLVLRSPEASARPLSPTQMESPALNMSSPEASARRPYLVLRSPEASAPSLSPTQMKSQSSPAFNLSSPEASTRRPYLVLRSPEASAWPLSPTQTESQSSPAFNLSSPEASTRQPYLVLRSPEASAWPLSPTQTESQSSSAVVLSSPEDAVRPSITDPESQGRKLRILPLPEAVVRPLPSPELAPPNLIFNHPGESGTCLRAFKNGTLTLKSVDHRAQVKHWELHTGSPLYHSEHSSGIDYYLFHDEILNIYRYVKGSGTTKLNLTIEELVRKPPMRIGSFTSGTETSTRYCLDADNGKILSQDYLASSTDTMAPAAEESFHSLKRVHSRSSNIITITRTDYSLSSFHKDTPLWNVSISSIKATGSLPFFSLEEVDLPVFFRREKDNLNWFMFPLASYTGRIEQGSTLVPLLQLNSSQESNFFQHQAKSKQVRHGQNNTCLCLDTLGISSEGGNNSLARTVDDVKESISVWPWRYSSPFLMIIVTVGSVFLCIFLYFRTSLCGGKKKKPIQSDKQVNGVGGQQLSKKEGKRKLGKLNNGSPTDCHDTVMSSKNGNAESHHDSDMQSNDRLPSTSTTASHGSYRFEVTSSEIAKGSNGTIIFEGNDDIRRLAVKRILLAHRDLAYKEFDILKSVSKYVNPNIIQLYGIKEDVNFVCISLERCDCCLSDLIKTFKDSYTAESQSSKSVMNSEKFKGQLWRQNRFPTPELVDLSRDAVKGLVFLHERGVIHGNLKPQNVLISGISHWPPIAKLSGMGMCEHLREDKTVRSPTGKVISVWQAPEQLNCLPLTPAVDIFSMGCILYYCLTAEKPFDDDVIRLDASIIERNFDPFLVDHVPEATYLLTLLLNKDPQMRPTASEVLEQPFYWTPEKTLQFFEDVGDRIRTESLASPKGVTPQLVIDLNKCKVVFGNDWKVKLDAAFITSLQGAYQFKLLSELLRAIRNKSSHYRELPKQVQAMLGEKPEGYVRYFTDKFPKLLMEVYKVVYKLYRNDDTFKRYFPFRR